MDLKKEIFLSNKIYYGKVTPQDWGGYDLGLFTKYGEPSVDLGGAFDDGTTSFVLSEKSKLVKTSFPHSELFDIVDLGITYEEGGKRAKLFVDTIETRFKAVLGDLRNLDSTSNQEDITIVVV